MTKRILEVSVTGVGHMLYMFAKPVHLKTIAIEFIVRSGQVDPFQQPNLNDQDTALTLRGKEIIV